MTQLSEGFGFDLTNAFARYREVLTDFFQSVFRAGISKPETHLDYLFFARRERCENFVSDRSQIRDRHRFRRDLKPSGLR